jgi:hypothetical protein
MAVRIKQEVRKAQDPVALLKAENAKQRHVYEVVKAENQMLREWVEQENSNE